MSTHTLGHEFCSERKAVVLVECASWNGFFVSVFRHFRLYLVETTSIVRISIFTHVTPEYAPSRRGESAAIFGIPRMSTQRKR